MTPLNQTALYLCPSICLSELILKYLLYRINIILNQGAITQTLRNMPQLTSFAYKQCQKVHEAASDEVH